MQTIRSVTDFINLENEIARHRMSGLQFMFRGQSDASWPIQTTLYRYFGTYWNEKDCWSEYIDRYEIQKCKVISNDILSYKPKQEHEDYYVLTMLRHLGFPCHLLDWSASLKTATIFACIENKNIDGSLWILSTEQKINDSPIKSSPFEIDKPLLICKEFELIPSGKSISDLPLGRLRRFRQNGFMSIIPCNYIAHNFRSLLDVNQNIRKITIANDVKKSLLDHLYYDIEVSNYMMANDLNGQWAEHFHT